MTPFIDILDNKDASPGLGIRWTRSNWSEIHNCLHGESVVGILAMLKGLWLLKELLKEQKVRHRGCPRQAVGTGNELSHPESCVQTMCV